MLAARLTAHPAPLRLMAADALLSNQKDDAAMAALLQIARLPNREIALATADVIQRRLGVDLGLGLGQPLPPLHSRQAADITRRVMTWAARPARQESDADEQDPAETPHQVIV